MPGPKTHPPSASRRPAASAERAQRRQVSRWALPHRQSLGEHRVETKRWRAVGQVLLLENSESRWWLEWWERGMRRQPYCGARAYGCGQSCTVPAQGFGNRASGEGLPGRGPQELKAQLLGTIDLPATATAVVGAWVGGVAAMDGATAAVRRATTIEPT